MIGVSRHSALGCNRTHSRKCLLIKSCIQVWSQKYSHYEPSIHLFGLILTVLKTLFPLTPLTLFVVSRLWQFGPWHHLYSLIFYSIKLGSKLNNHQLLKINPTTLVPHFPITTCSAISMTI